MNYTDSVLSGPLDSLVPLVWVRGEACLMNYTGSVLLIASSPLDSIEFVCCSLPIGKG